MELIHVSCNLIINSYWYSGFKFIAYFLISRKFAFEHLDAEKGKLKGMGHVQTQSKNVNNLKGNRIKHIT